MSVLTTSNGIASALRTVPGLTVYTEPDANPNVPALFLQPPELTWPDTYNATRPTAATFSLTLVVAGNGYSVAALEPLLDAISDALAALTDAVLTQAVPANWPISPDSRLPAYQLTLESSVS